MTRIREEKEKEMLKSIDTATAMLRIIRISRDQFWG